MWLTFVFLYRIMQNFDGVKFWWINRFRVLAGKNVGKFTVAYIRYCSESGIWLGKILVNGVSHSPNPPKFSPTKIFCCMVYISDYPCYDMCCIMFNS